MLCSVICSVMLSSVICSVICFALPRHLLTPPPPPPPPPQNCEVVIAADEYYRKCISEPRGSRASWNTRDQHMATTLLRIQGRLGDPKCIVWAHNSHVGDSTATRRGGVSFDRNEKWNLGQMARATFGHDKVWVVGQYTYDGTVTAANEWGGKHESRALRKVRVGCISSHLVLIRSHFDSI